MSSDLARLEYVADLVVRRVILEVGRGPELEEALERAYPFADIPLGRTVWEDAIERNIKGRLTPERARSSDDPSEARSA